MKDIIRKILREEVENEERDKSNLKVKRAIERVLDLVITNYVYNKDETELFFFDKNKKCLITYKIKEKKIWYDHYLLNEIISQMVRVRFYIKDLFKETLKIWFEKNFKSKGFEVGDKYWSNGPNIEGANIALY
jgi:hypothetical protein